jgi:hypothetical protein
MDSSTGCISIGTPVDARIEIERVVEYCKPTASSCLIWVDIFCNNPSDVPQSLLVLHRGSFVARDVTRRSWLENSDIFSFERTLTRRLTRLHKNFDPILEKETNAVKLGKYEYLVPENDYEVSIVVGGQEDIDSPFTMWNISEIPGKTRQMIRLSLTMGDSTFLARIGGRDSFHAYGEAILLQKIEFEDLASFEGRRCSGEYRDAFDSFKSSKHVVPDIFEYLLVSEDDTPLGWEVTPLSAGLSARWIPYPDMQNNTVWFVTDISRASFSLVGRRKRNAFAVRFTADQTRMSSAPQLDLSSVTT